MNKIKNAVLLMFMFALLCFPKDVFSVPANPKPAEVLQADGTRITVVLKGDEFYNWHEDSRGYTILKDNTSKNWVYAAKNADGSLSATSYIVGKVSPMSLGLRKSLRDDVKTQKAKARRDSYNRQLKNTYQKSKSVAQEKSAFTTGTKRNLVVLVQFSDSKFTDSKPFNALSTEAQIRQAYDDFFNKTNYTDDGAIGSVRDFFNEASYGAFTLESVISPIVTLDGSYRDYGELGTIKDSRDMVLEALAKLKAAGYNFRNVWTAGSEPEGLTFIHAGGGAEYSGNDPYYIWSHKYELWGDKPPVTYDGITFTRYHTEPARRGWDAEASTQGITRIGVICHEHTHFLGIPDLYDTTYASEGLGVFCLMSGGNWNGSDGEMPAHHSVWVKYKLDWIIPKTAQSGQNNIGISAADSTAFYRLDGKNFASTEYFLMENRQRAGFDRGLPGETDAKRGVLIYHIDESQPDNDDHTHYMVDLEEADGTANFLNDHLATGINVGADGDYFRADTVTAFNDANTASPNSKSYTNQMSEIDISGISASGSVMSFIFTGAPDYETFVDALTDNTGLQFLNFIMKYNPAKTKADLKLLPETEQNNINKYFMFTAAGAKMADDMAVIYDSYVSTLKVYGIETSQTGVVTQYQSTVVDRLNYNLTASSQTIKSVGTISDGDTIPVSAVSSQSKPRAAVNTNKRFTGTAAVENIETYVQNLGYLIYSFAGSQLGVGYDIIEITTVMDLSLYVKKYFYTPGANSKFYTGLQNIVCFPNPARNGEVHITNLPTIADKLDINIFTTTGKIVKVFAVKDTKAVGSGARSIKWDLKNESGDNVAPGVYFVVIKTSDDKKVEKIAVIR